MEQEKRGQWSSGIGFILASAGSAIGLGNIWKFPGKVSAGGGGAYILVYMAIVFTIGISVMLTELTVGRNTQKNTVGAMRSLSRRWSFVGYIGVICGFIVLSYYCIVGGHVLKYTAFYLSGARFPDTPAAYYADLISSPLEPILWGLAFLAAAGFIVWRGIAGGIERANKILMPALMILLIAVMVHALSMPGAEKGVRFLLTPNFSAMTPASTLSALGQALFSLSIGLGTTCTYGSYLKKEDNLASSAVIVCVFDTLIAMIAAFTIIPAVFATGTEPGSGGAFAFVALPRVFSQMTGGAFFGGMFYLLLFFAALTSAIALMEGVVAYLTEERGMARSRAVLAACGAMAVPGAVYSLSHGALELHGVWYTLREGLSFPPLHEAMELLTDNLLIPLGALGFCIFTGHIWGAHRAVDEIRAGGRVPFRAARLWSAMIRFIAPAVISTIFILGILGVIEY